MIFLQGCILIVNKLDTECVIGYLQVSHYSLTIKQIISIDFNIERWANFEFSIKFMVKQSKQVFFLKGDINIAKYFWVDPIKI